ncbi:cation efflux family protein [Cladophialophora carrionii]|uniref:Cation efflux family protein n=1 Tax=Cladophialophora carrionii TaxID=86049 RepID=A0A1C1CE23_9EURO|nr:cation efflux family protein [Cladophialophora carrionii]
MDMASSARRPHYQLGGLSSFIPLNEEPSTLSTRGQRLPTLIQSRSSASLFTLPRRPTTRRGSVHSHHSNEDEEHGHDDDLDFMSPPRRRTLPPSEVDPRRMSLGPEILMTPQMRSMRLIGQSNPRYHWHKYYKTEEELKRMKKPIRKYYERNNFLITQYIYIDKLLDSSLPHNLIQEYSHQRSRSNGCLNTISEEQNSATNTPVVAPMDESAPDTPTPIEQRLKRTPKDLYKLPSEQTPLLPDEGEEHEDSVWPEINLEDIDNGVESNDPIVTVAIFINLVANIILLAGKIVVIVLTSSLSVLASLVDAALDFLSTAIVWTTTKLISRQDQYAYPIGRRRLEPVGVLVFSVIMITSFFQVALECFNRLLAPDHSVVELGIPAIAIMLSTVGIKGFCWFWCRLVKNSSVQALAQDAATDVVFNIFSIIFPLLGFYFQIWWLDALGGLLLSCYVIFNWSKTSVEHVRNLCGVSATADQRNVLLYLAMRFAKPIRHIQGLQAYHTGDKLNVEVDIVLDENMSLRDSHDLGESLQYVLESVPTVDRAFVHADYADWNLPSHMNQQA